MGEYEATIMKLLDQMAENIKMDIVRKMETLPITEDGVNLDESGLRGGTTTWTYAVEEGALQFSKLGRMAKKFRGMLSGEDGILTKYYRKKLAKKKQ